MASLFHKFKRAVAEHTGGEKNGHPVALCPEYDSIKAEFEHLHDSMIRIRQQLLMYKEGNSRLWMSANTLAGEFAVTLEADPQSPEAPHHPYSTMATTLKNSHSALASDRERLDTMLEACLNPIGEQVDKYNETKARMANHDQVKQEVIYYQQKVEQLKKTRDSSSKQQSAGDKEKYERNVQKLADQEAHFQALDAALVSDLKHLYAHRIAVLGPIMLAFVCAERQMVQSYQTAINEVQLVDVNEANIWLEQHEAEIAARHREQQKRIDPINNASPVAASNSANKTDPATANIIPIDNKTTTTTTTTSTTAATTTTIPTPSETEKTSRKSSTDGNKAQPKSAATTTPSTTTTTAAPASSTGAASLDILNQDLFSPSANSGNTSNTSNTSNSSGSNTNTTAVSSQSSTVSARKNSSSSVSSKPPSSFDSYPLPSVTSAKQTTSTTSVSNTSNTSGSGPGMDIFSPTYPSSNTAASSGEFSDPFAVLNADSSSDPTISKKPLSSHPAIGGVGDHPVNSGEAELAASAPNNKLV